MKTNPWEDDDALNNNDDVLGERSGRIMDDAIPNGPFGMRYSNFDVRDNHLSNAEL